VRKEGGVEERLKIRERAPKTKSKLDGRKMRRLDVSGEKGTEKTASARGACSRLCGGGRTGSLGLPPRKGGKGKESGIITLKNLSKNKEEKHLTGKGGRKGEAQTGRGEGKVESVYEALTDGVKKKRKRQ